MKNLILISLISLAALYGQDRSVIFNTSNPAYTCNIAGGSYSNYTCDEECDLLAEDYCTILVDGFSIDQNNTLADKFTVNADYALEAFGVYIKLHPEANPLYNHYATVVLRDDDDNTPGTVLGEWTVNIGTANY